MERWRIDGKFLRVGDRRVFLRLVTYGPFPGGWPDDLEGDLLRVRRAGFEAVRLYQWPTRAFLDAAQAAGLRVFAGLEWRQACDVFRHDTLSDARQALHSGLAEAGDHPALAGVFIANELPADLVRWMGPARVLEALEQLIDEGKGSAPELIWAYANYPATEYLEPGNADLTAMNVYLERETDFRAYLQRLHHIAGDRPVLISEFGLDSRRHGVDRQAETLGWGMRAACDAGMAGLAVYAWSDRWWNNGATVLDWDFGLNDRDGQPKPALSAVQAVTTGVATHPSNSPSFSVIICTRNGRDRLGDCLRAIAGLEGVAYETVVVDDGSDDGSAGFVEEVFPGVRVVRVEPGGLSAARNAGAEAATGEVLAFTDDDCRPDPLWLAEMAGTFVEGAVAAGGPNLPPSPRDRTEAVVAAAPGAASHVMLDDTEAEHVPGCNLVVRRSTYFEIGGFDPDFHTAGDDVDFCWRLRDAGHRIEFVPTAFVWHHRRPTLEAYLRQQRGYGQAEALLRRKHPQRFSPSGDAIWHGTIYSGGPVRATHDTVIYHGPMGLAGYQNVVARTQPLRGLHPRFDDALSRWQLRLLGWLAPRLRSWARIRHFRGPLRPAAEATPPADAEFACWSEVEREALLRDWLADGWHAGGASDGWDLEKQGTRVLIAAERGSPSEKRLRFRVWGDPSRLPLPDGAERLEPGKIPALSHGRGRGAGR